MAREIGFEPMIDTNCLDNTGQSLAILNQMHIGDRFSLATFSEQLQHNIANKLKNQKLRCYLCETPKQEYSLIRTFGELVCRGCFNYEGKDRVEQLIENARQFKFAHLLSNSSKSADQVIRPGAIAENDDSSSSSLRLPDKLHPESCSSLRRGNSSSNRLTHNSREHQHKCAFVASNGKEKPFEEQTIVKLDRRHRTEVQLPATVSSFSSDAASGGVKVLQPSSTTNNKQPKTVLPSIDNFLSVNNDTHSQVETKQQSSSLASAIQKHNSINQTTPVIYNKQSAKFSPANNLCETNQHSQQSSSIVRNSLSPASSSAHLSNRVDYKLIANEEQKSAEDGLLSSRMKQIHQQNHQSRLHFDPNNLPYPILLPTTKSITKLSSSQDHYQHSNWFRHPSMALRSPNGTAIYPPTASSQDISASITGGGRRARSFLSNGANQLNGQTSALPFGSYPIMCQGVYGSSGAIYYSPYQQQQQQQQHQHQLQRQHQFHHYPLSPSSQVSSRGQDKSPSLLPSPTSSSSYSSTSCSYSNALANYSSIFYPKSGQVITDSRLQSNISGQEQRESQQQVLPQCLPQSKLSVENNNLPMTRQQQQNNKSRQQTIQKETSFERILSDSPTTRSQLNGQILFKTETSSNSPPRFDRLFLGSQLSPQLVPKQDSILLNNQPSQMKKSLHCRALNYRDDSNLVRNLQLYQSNISATCQRKLEVEVRKTIELADRRSLAKSIYDNNSYEKQKEILRIAQENESASILRQKLSDKRLNNATPSERNVSEETIVIDVEDDLEEPTNKVNTKATTKFIPINSENSELFDPQSLESQKTTTSNFQTPADQLSKNAAIKRLISNKSSSNSSYNQRTVESICARGGSRSNSNNLLPADNNNTNSKQNFSRNSSSELKLNCLICSKDLADRHFVQCPSVLIHKFCFSCTRNSIRNRRERYNLREGETEKIYCLSGKMCPLTGQQEPWTFMTSEVETIFREKDNQTRTSDQIQSLASSSLTSTTTTLSTTSSSLSPSPMQQQKLKRKSRPINDERIKKRPLLEPTNQKSLERPKGSILEQDN